MAKTLKLKIVTPERQVLTKDVDQVILPGVAGSFGVLPEHAPMLVALKPGMVRVLHGNQSEVYSCSGGYAEVTGEEVVLLADALETGAEINPDRAKKAQQRAEERLAKRIEGIDTARAQAAVLRAMVRLKVYEQNQLAGKK
jgi:F-type H+-transporting ATPase subunit epsilon